MTREAPTCNNAAMNSAAKPERPPFAVGILQAGDDLPAYLTDVERIDLEETLAWADRDSKSVMFIVCGNSFVTQTDNCEPEDAIFGRRYGWIEGALNAAYAQGVKLFEPLFDREKDNADTWASDLDCICQELDLQVGVVNNAREAILTEIKSRRPARFIACTISSYLEMGDKWLELTSAEQTLLIQELRTMESLLDPGAKLTVIIRNEKIDLMAFPESCLSLAKWAVDFAKDCAGIRKE